MAVWKLNYTFGHQGNTYIADIIHYSLLSREEIEEYKIQKNTFLVHLFSSKGITSFELFPDEDLQWNALPGVDKEIAEIIGTEIDNQSM